MIIEMCMGYFVIFYYMCTICNDQIKIIGMLMTSNIHDFFYFSLPMRKGCYLSEEAVVRVSRETKGDMDI